MSSPREIAEGFISHKAEHGCNTLLSPQESESVCRAIAEIDSATGSGKGEPNHICSATERLRAIRSFLNGTTEGQA